jgi:hypothetical protein
VFGWLGWTAPPDVLKRTFESPLLLGNNLQPLLGSASTSGVMAMDHHIIIAVGGFNYAPMMRRLALGAIDRNPSRKLLLQHGCI